MDAWLKSPGGNYFSKIRFLKFVALIPEQPLNPIFFLFVLDSPLRRLKKRANNKECNEQHGLNRGEKFAKSTR